MPHAESTLDPSDWEGFRALCHKALDQALDRQRDVRDRPVWRPLSDEARAMLSTSPPREGSDVESVYDDLATHVLPFTLGNTHPAFWGWVHGSGTAMGMLASMLRGAINANLGGREHAPVHVERQVIAWCKEIMGFPDSASGLLVSGTSMATLMALAVARHACLGAASRKEGLRSHPQLLAYASTEAHSSVSKALELLGIGRDHLRVVPVDSTGAMDVTELSIMIESDRRDDTTLPLAVIATVGSVNIGAIDDVAAIRKLCDTHGLWLHVDGAFGAAAMLAPSISSKVRALSEADSLAFDFHKWLHVTYDSGCVLVRDGALHLDTFGGRADYLSAEARGAAAGEPWFCDYGIELSRGFRALDVWMTLRHHGLDALGAMIEKNCAQAKELAARVDAEPDLECLAPVALNVVCFRYRPADVPISDEDLNDLNRRIVVELHERGIAIPSTTRIAGALAIRVCICNHRTSSSDLEQMVDEIILIGLGIFQ